MMIKVIGLRRVIVLGCLVALNAVLVSCYLFILQPMLSQTQADLDSTQQQINQTRTKISNIKSDLIEYQKNLPRYEQLQQSGFFSNQDRLELKSEFEKVQSLSGLKRFSFLVDDRRDLYTLNAGDTKLRMLASRIQIDNVVGFFDTDFYKLVGLMRNAFPAHIHFTSFSLQRSGALNAETLNKIGKGTDVSLINAEATFEWLTVIPAPAPEPKNSEVSGGRR